MTGTYGSASDSKTYTAHSDQAYVNLLYEGIIGTSFHQFQTGVSFLYDDVRETYEGLPILNDKKWCRVHFLSTPTNPKKHLA